MAEQKILIVNYGRGNIASLSNAIENIGLRCDVVTNPADLSLASHVVIPGVGSFSAAMNDLSRDGWVDALDAHVHSGKCLLGICLGMQLLFSNGTEGEPCKGLGYIPGSVQRMESRAGVKLPHVGWNTLLDCSDHVILRGANLNADVYFTHSYHAKPDAGEDGIAYFEHGSKYCAIAARKNVVGMQFHPEKSQPIGEKLLENFFEWTL